VAQPVSAAVMMVSRDVDAFCMLYTPEEVSDRNMARGHLLQ